MELVPARVSPFKCEIVCKEERSFADRRGRGVLFLLKRGNNETHLLERQWN